MTNTREALEAAVFALWLFDYEDEENAEFYVQRWRTFRTSLNEEHLGDCTGFPMSCGRCQAEWVIEIADRFERGTLTNEPDDLDLNWQCFLCGAELHTIGPRNRHVPHYVKRRRAGKPPGIILCDDCAAIKDKQVDSL